MRGDITKLRQSLTAAKAGGDARDDAYREVRRLAHDLRGQGTTFGYPLVTRIAQSVSQTLKERAPGANVDAQLGAHFDAISAVIEGDIADAHSGDAAKIIELLQLAIGRAVA